MSDCFVLIAARTEDGCSEECVRGKLQTVSKGFLVFYSQDGDNVSVSASDDSFTMQREGDTAIEAYFTLSGSSRMEFIFGDGRGEIPVTTEAYSLCRTEDGFVADLCYVLGGGQDGKNFNLKFTVKGILEEK